MSANKMLSVGEKRYLLSWMLLLSFVRLLDQCFILLILFKIIVILIKSIESSLGT